MPYYRIVIWTTHRREPFVGIRLIDNYNISAVQMIMRKKAVDTYRRDLVDVEVQMLPKICTAVQKHLRSIARKREKKSRWEDEAFTPVMRRKDYYNR